MSTLTVSGGTPEEIEECFRRYRKEEEIRKSKSEIEKMKKEVER